MYINSITQSISTVYNKENVCNKAQQRQISQNCRQNNDTGNNVSFCGIKTDIGGKTATAGIFLALFIGLFSVAKCNYSKNENNPYKGRDREYYYELDKNHMDSIAKGLEDTVTQKQANQRDRIIEMKDTLLSIFPYETPQRDNLENIFLNRIDSVTRSSTREGKDIANLEEAQVILDLKDSINAKYPDKEVDAKL